MWGSGERADQGSGSLKGNSKKRAGAKRWPALLKLPGSEAWLCLLLVMK